jgi:CheY-like chemotaxis protein
LLPALACLGRIDALLEAVVAGHEQFLDPSANVPFHKSTLTARMNGMRARKSKPKPLRVLIADDHRLFAEALEAILGTDERIEVVGQASDGGKAVELARKLDPDVVLMDVSMPVLDGFEATREIRARSDDVRVLMLTGSNSRADVDRSRAAGASGYVTKDRIASELVATIVEVTRRRLP